MFFAILFHMLNRFFSGTNEVIGSLTIAAHL
jgi:hypothetical protein